MASPFVAVGSDGATSLESPSRWFAKVLLRTVPVVAARRSPFPGDRLLGFWSIVAVRSPGRHRVGLDGEGLGGGYCTPPNQKSGERSELVFRGVWGEPNRKSYPQVGFVRASFLLNIF